MLHRVFGDPIGRFRPNGVGFIYRQRIRFSIDGASCRGEDEPFDIRLYAILEQIDGAENIHLCIEDRLRNGGAHIILRGKVTHRVETPLGEEVGYLLGADIEFMKFRFLRHILLLAGAEVVNHHHCILFVQQGITKM